MRILITGANGLLGQKLVKRCMKHKLNFLAVSKGENRNPTLDQENYFELDISIQQDVERVLNDYNPTHIINAAAITNVDFCEEYPELTHAVNVQAVQLLFDWCSKRNAHFQQLSTDFVFDGKKGGYSEEDEVNPLSVYGKSKVDAELLLQNSVFLNWSIIRTIIVYGTGFNLSRSNLVLWARDAMKNKRPIQVVNDQFRAPTWADDLAYACIETLIRQQTGVFHVCGPETLSIYELVMRMAAFYEADKHLLTTISSDTLGQPANRPPKTGFNIKKARQILMFSPTSFNHSLELLEKELSS